MPSPIALGRKGFVIRLGPSHLNPVDDWDVLFDNVLVTTLP